MSVALMLSEILWASCESHWDLLLYQSHTHKNLVISSMLLRDPVQVERI